MMIKDGLRSIKGTATISSVALAINVGVVTNQIDSIKEQVHTNREETSKQLTEIRNDLRVIQSQLMQERAQHEGSSDTLRKARRI